MAIKIEDVRHDLVLYLYEQSAADPAKQQQKKKAGKAEKQEPHLDAQALLHGCLVKGRHEYRLIRDKKKLNGPETEWYAWNGWNYLGSLPKGDVRDIYRKHSVDWYHFYESARKPNFYQSFPLKALGGFDKKRVYGFHKRLLSGAATEGAYRKLKDVVKSLRGFVGTCDEAHRDEAEARLKYVERVERLVGKRDGQDKAFARSPEATVTQQVGCALPYPWQAHHVLPMNCFYKYFESWQLRLIASSTYDINHGSNIIFLPENPEDMKWHGLPYHTTSHAEYDLRLKSKFGKIKSRLNDEKKKAEAGQPHDNLKELAEMELKDLETETFEFVAGMGPTRLS